MASLISCKDAGDECINHLNDIITPLGVAEGTASLLRASCPQGDKEKCNSLLLSANLAIK